MSENTEQRWIYDVMISHIDDLDNRDELESYYSSELRQRGQYGWELVSVTMLRPDTGQRIKKGIVYAKEIEPLPDALFCSPQSEE